MSLPKPQYIANLLVQNGSNRSFEKLANVVESIMSQQLPGVSEEEIWDWIEQYEDDIANELFEKESDSRNDAVDPSFNISTYDDGYYVKFAETPGITLLRRVQKASPPHFESFCAEILEKLGGNCSVTGSPHDGGIDFWASELMINNLGFMSTIGSRVLVVGQAKRFQDGNHVKETDLREFVGASLRKVDELKRTRSEQFGILQPVVLAFWTTSDFHKNAKEYAKSLGIWYLGGPALCQLATRLEVPCREANS